MLPLVHVPPGGPHWLCRWRWHRRYARSLTSYTDEGEQLEQTFLLADTQLDPEPDLEEVLASSGAEAELDSDDESRPLPPSILQRYFISVTGSAQKRRLHLGGACWRLPGKDYAVFVECGEDVPESSAFHAVCKQCFPRGVQRDVPDEELTSSGSSKTSEDDSA